MNNILDLDSYKSSHFLQFPKDCTHSYYYAESRGGKYSEIPFFSLQYILKTAFSEPVTAGMVHEAETFLNSHGLPFPASGWSHIVNKLGGKLPLRIKAVDEGLVIPVKNVLLTVENTVPGFAWLPGWFETQLMRVWYGCTVAATSWHIKALIRSYLEKTSNDISELPFKLHDFGSRGVSSRESALIGGMSHLINFMGSDTVVGVYGAKKYYNHPMAGFSIPASEHSTITAWGRDFEKDAYENMITQFGKPGGIFACVSDSYDLWNAIDNLWGGSLREKVINSGATLVVRPDSGNPAEVALKALTLLDNKFGHTINRKAYKVLNNVRVIYGDGINEESIREIMEAVTKAGFSASNINFGMGGALLQQVNRDTQKFAIKASEVTRSGKPMAICKDPITDPGKRSKSGRLSLITTPNGDYVTCPEVPFGDHLKTVYENGVITREVDLNHVRRNTELQLA